MKRLNLKQHRFLSIILLPFMTFCCVIVIIRMCGFRINLTRSIPLGIYRVVSDIPKKGDYAYFCPPDVAVVREAKRSGIFGDSVLCDGFTPLMKQVAAVDGDVVDINDDGVFVNGVKRIFSKPIKADGKGRKLDVFYLSKYKLRKNEWLMMTDTIPNSFDARYFGVVETVPKKIERVIKW